MPKAQECAVTKVCHGALLRGQNLIVSTRFHTTLKKISFSQRSRCSLSLLRGSLPVLPLLASQQSKYLQSPCVAVFWHAVCVCTFITLTKRADRKYTDKSLLILLSSDNDAIKTVEECCRHSAQILQKRKKRNVE